MLKDGAAGFAREGWCSLDLGLSALLCLALPLAGCGKKWSMDAFSRAPTLVAVVSGVREVVIPLDSLNLASQFEVIRYRKKIPCGSCGSGYISRVELSGVDAERAIQGLMTEALPQSKPTSLPSFQDDLVLGLYPDNDRIIVWNQLSLSPAEQARRSILPRLAFRPANVGAGADGFREADAGITVFPISSCETSRQPDRVSFLHIGTGEIRFVSSFASANRELLLARDPSGGYLLWWE